MFMVCRKDSILMVGMTLDAKAWLAQTALA
jgi:hypothetical protein